MHLPDFKEARTCDKRKYNRIDFKIDDSIKKKILRKEILCKNLWMSDE